MIGARQTTASAAAVAAPAGGIEPRRPANLRVVHDERFGFASSFDPDTGFYYRTNVKDAAGRDTGRDPFRASLPHLLDVGIMGHCVHGRLGYCLAAGVECYQSGPTVGEPNMTLDDFTWLADQCRGRVYQFALGGRGDPDQHEDFEAILAACRDRNIVPNFTTSGLGLTPRLARLAREYCGAVAVSWYRREHTRRAIDLLLEAGVTTNIHYVVGRRTIDEAIEMMEGNGSGADADGTGGASPGAAGIPGGVNRVVFLLHKPVGLGRRENMLQLSDPRVTRFFGLFNDAAHCEKAGFDSCCVPGLINLAPAIHPATIDTCEGARFSAYVSPELRLLPCSFDQEGRWAVDLRAAERAVRQDAAAPTPLGIAWESDFFEDFRHRLASACPGCGKRELCLGGCPIVSEIVLCEKRHRKGGAGC